MRERLRLIHNKVAWVIYLLLFTGTVLYLPTLRGVLSRIRFIFLYLHDGLGIYLIILLTNYFSLGKEHWTMTPNIKKVNITAIAIFIIGWFTTGVPLLGKSYFKPTTVHTALVSHDLITIVGATYIIFHSLTHIGQLPKKHERNEKQPLRGKITEMPLISRKTFLSLLGGFIVLVGLAGIYPLINKGLLRQPNCNKMLPEPMPAKQSKPPIGGGYKGSFREYSIAAEPCFSNENWQFTLSGLIREPRKFSWGEFLKIPRKVQVSDFHCITGWTVTKVTYEGIPLSEMLTMAGIEKGAKYVKFYSGDGEYTDGLSVEQAMMDDVMIALMMDGVPIPQKFGGPARLVVPKMYGYKSVKWLNKIELTNTKPEGYWEQRGYKNDAWVAKSR